MTRLQKSRQRQFTRQASRCHYCRQPMWQGDLAAFARRHGLCEARARLLQATAEHLVARSEGGGDGIGNIVAACLFCNAHRHRVPQALSPEEYRAEVRALLAQGAWHGLCLTAG